MKQALGLAMALVVSGCTAETAIAPTSVSRGTSAVSGRAIGASTRSNKTIPVVYVLGGTGVEEWYGLSEIGSPFGYDGSHYLLSIFTDHRGNVYAGDQATINEYPPGGAQQPLQTWNAPMGESNNWQYIAVCPDGRLYVDYFISESSEFMAIYAKGSKNPTTLLAPPHDSFFGPLACQSQSNLVAMVYSGNSNYLERFEPGRKHGTRLPATPEHGSLVNFQLDTKGRIAAFVFPSGNPPPQVYVEFFLPTSKVPFSTTTLSNGGVFHGDFTGEFAFAADNTNNMWFTMDGYPPDQLAPVQEYNKHGKQLFNFGFEQIEPYYIATGWAPSPN